MKTAMQELIDWTERYEGNMISANQVILKAYNLLEKEREQLLKEYHRGMVDEFNIILNVAKPKPLTKTNK